MTNKEKNNCLKLRYQFKEDFDDLRGYPQAIRHSEWVKYVKNSNLTRYEKLKCIEEFIPNI